MKSLKKVSFRHSFSWLFVRRNGTNEIPILAVVSTGDLWQFGKLERDLFIRHPMPASIQKPEEVLGILDGCFAACEENAKLNGESL